MEIITEKTCPICGKKRIKKPFYIDKKEFYVYVDTCNCLADRMTKKEVFQAKIYKKKQIRSVLLQFPRRQRGLRLSRIESENKQFYIDYCEKFKPRKSKGLLLLGNCGNGKTTTLCCVGKELIQKGYQKVYYGTMTDYLNEMTSSYSVSSKVRIEDLINKWCNADLVIIDDLGREKYTDKRLENVFLFFDKLYASCTTFCVSANPEMLEKIKDIPDFRAILDRFDEALSKVVFCEKSKRKTFDKTAKTL